MSRRWRQAGNSPQPLPRPGSHVGLRRGLASDVPDRDWAFCWCRSASLRWYVWNVTWVCAASTIFGYGALYSDVQVTFPDGHTKDLLQKAYPVGNFVAAGFAGSVRIGFRLLQSLSDFVALPPEDARIMAWEPAWVSGQWAPIAKSLFDREPSSEKSLGSRILVVGASPTEACGLGAKIYFTRFASPDFQPCLMSRAIKTCSIGSGAGISEYKQHLKPHFRLAAGIHRAEIGHQNGWLARLAFRCLGPCLIIHVLASAGTSTY